MISGEFNWDSYPADGLEAVERAVFEAWDSMQLRQQMGTLAYELLS